MDTNSGSCGAGYRCDQNCTRGPNATRRAARVSGICATRSLSVVSGDLLGDLSFEIMFWLMPQRKKGPRPAGAPMGQSVQEIQRGIPLEVRKAPHFVRGRLTGAVLRRANKF